MGMVMDVPNVVVEAFLAVAVPDKNLTPQHLIGCSTLALSYHQTALRDGGSHPVAQMRLLM
jgi:hypothetical protein